MRPTSALALSLLVAVAAGQRRNVIPNGEYQALTAIWPVSTSQEIDLPFGPSCRGGCRQADYQWRSGLRIDARQNADVVAVLDGTIVGMMGSTMDVAHATYEGKLFYITYIGVRPQGVNQIGQMVRQGQTIAMCDLPYLDVKLREFGLDDHYARNPLILLPYVPYNKMYVEQATTTESPLGAGWYDVRLSIFETWGAMVLDSVSLELDGYGLVDQTAGTRFDTKSGFVSFEDLNAQYVHPGGVDPPADCPFAAAHGMRWHLSDADFDGMDIVVVMNPNSARAMRIQMTMSVQVAGLPPPTPPCFNIRLRGMYTRRSLTDPTLYSADEGLFTSCEHDECDPAGDAVCDAAANQRCVDHDWVQLNDWECVCTAPYVGDPALMVPATCVLDECLDDPDLCGADQLCSDAGPAAGDYACSCVAPYTGQSARGSPAVCAHDECTADTVCGAAGQVCEDPDRTAAGDWECVCPAPFDNRATGAAAACAVDECTFNTCAGVHQACSDPDLAVLDDWKCGCEPPWSGLNVLGLLSCTLDECSVSATAAVCTAVGQTCSDPDTATEDSWECECMPPQVGRSTAAAAICVLDECTTADAAVCMAAGQTCADPDFTVLANWECRCMPPSQGFQTTAAAVCRLDECTTTTVCADADQTCTDSDDTVDGDWVCTCMAPKAGTATGAAATCTLDECTLTVVCSAAGQDCVDGDRGVDGDWECRCRAPKAGAAVAGPAQCTVDECTLTAVCTDNGQGCGDPDDTVDDNWECTCMPPYTGSATAAAAPCRMDECVTTTVCADVGQMCTDPDETTDDDYMCTCAAPQTGSAVAAPAMCTLDECTLPGAVVCDAAMQDCRDDDQAADGSWLCVCRAPAKGSAVAGAATCALDECTAMTPCAAAGQQCSDPDFTTAGDYQCVCMPPAVGFAVATAAACVFDECIPNGAVCSAAGQDCRDDDQTVGDNWQCGCRAPAMGVRVGGAATCTLDECTLAAAAVCDGATQDCVDADQTADGDWECVCRAPQAGRGVAAAALCTLDECTTTSVCEDAGQLCEDADLRQMGDWECICTPPYASRRAGMPVVACEVDECTLTSVCTDADQGCRDRDLEALDDWVCECRAPATGVATMEPARCSVNECDVDTTCEDAGQRCADFDLFKAGTYECICIPPRMGGALAAAAECTLDECLADGGPICAAANQTCTDPDTSADGDWTCTCTPPKAGTATATAAMCTIDECTTVGAALCATADQDCTEPDPAVDDDWTCTCRPPYMGSASTGPAACDVDECDIPPAVTVCLPGQQDCTDDDLQTLGTWVCSCRAPRVGAANTSLAACTLDECTIGSVLSVCEGAGQDCVDGDIGVEADWQCVCRAPAAGNATADVAECELDECVANDAVCAAARQDCEDPDTTVPGDWTCTCRFPKTGNATADAAVCTVDECIIYGTKALCAAAGQDCRDPDAAVDNDWACVCRAPYVGTATAVVAACAVDECRTNGSAVCDAADQDCVDEDLVRAGDWRCTCRAPLLGNATAATAQCTLDECGLPAASACANAGQTCNDPNTTLDGDWECVCPGPAGKTAVAGPAACDVDECDIPPAVTVCLPGQQDCTDDDLQTLGTWVCSCRAPRVGAANTSLAACTLDECTIGSVLSVCEGAGQDCVDGDIGVEADWQCVCRAPAAGNATADVAECELDECMFATNCSIAGQGCVDPDRAVGGDWKCVCRAPAVGEATAGAAVCTLDECSTPAAGACEDAGQACRDPDVTVDGDWLCLCEAPAGGEATGGPAVCVDPPADPPVVFTMFEDNSEAAAAPVAPATVRFVTAALVQRGRCTCTPAGACAVAGVEGPGALVVSVAPNWHGNISVACAAAAPHPPVVVVVRPVNDVPRATPVELARTVFALESRSRRVRVPAWLVDVVPGAVGDPLEAAEPLVGTCAVTHGDVFDGTEASPQVVVDRTARTADLVFSVRPGGALRDLPAGVLAAGGRIACTLTDPAGAVVAAALNVTLQVPRLAAPPPAVLHELSSANINTKGVTIEYVLAGGLAFRPSLWGSVLPVHVLDPSAAAGPPPPQSMQHTAPPLTLRTDHPVAASTDGLAGRAAARGTAPVVLARVAADGLSLSLQFADPRYMLIAPNTETVTVEIPPQLFAAPLEEVEAFCGTGACTHTVVIKPQTPVFSGQADVEAAVQTTALVGLATSIAGAGPLGTTGVNAGILAMSTEAMKCPTGDAPEPLDRTLNPTGLLLGGRRYASYNGAVVGTLILVVGLVAACGLVARCRAQDAGVSFADIRDDDGDGQHKLLLKHNRLIYVLGRARFGALLIPGLFVYSGAVVASGTVLLYSSIGFKLLAIVVVGAFLALLPYYIVKVTSVQTAYARLVPIEEAGLLGRVFWGWDEWVPRAEVAEGPGWLQLHRLVFDGFKLPWRNFLAAQCGVLLTLGTLIAWQPADIVECRVRACIMTMLLALVSVAIIVWRPFLAPYENVMEALIHLMETGLMASTLAAIGTSRPDESIGGRAAEQFGMAAVYLLLAKLVMDMSVYVLDEYALYKEGGGRGVVPCVVSWLCCWHGPQKHEGLTEYDMLGVPPASPSALSPAGARSDADIDMHMSDDILELRAIADPQLGCASGHLDSYSMSLGAMPEPSPRRPSGSSPTAVRSARAPQPAGGSVISDDLEMSSRGLDVCVRPSPSGAPPLQPPHLASMRDVSQPSLSPQRPSAFGQQRKGPITSPLMGRGGPRRTSNCALDELVAKQSFRRASTELELPAPAVAPPKRKSDTDALNTSLSFRARPSAGRGGRLFGADFSSRNIVRTQSPPAPQRPQSPYAQVHPARLAAQASRPTSPHGAGTIDPNTQVTI